MRLVPLLALAALLPCGCSTSLQEYVCASSEDCSGERNGRCEPSGHCSFPDPDCDEGFRFGDNSGSESGSCVGASASIDASMLLVDAQEVDAQPEQIWQHRHKLTINNGVIGQGLVDFPLLVVLTTARVDYTRIQNSGQDLRFTSEDGTPLAHEVEQWNSEGKSFVWVRVPQIDANSDTGHIFIYYGNAEAVDRQSVADVWSNGYEAVYHLSESGSTYANSAGGEHAANNVGTTKVQGRVGSARLFNGVNAYLKLNEHNPVSMLQGVTGMTLSAWVQPQDLSLGSPTQEIVAISLGSSCGGLSRATTLLSGNPDNEVIMAARAGDSDPSFPITTTGLGMVENSWYLINGVFDVDFANNDDLNFPYGRATAVINDTLYQTGDTDRLSMPQTASTQPQCASIGANDNGQTNYFAGVIDEVRISSVDRTTAWLRAQYLAMQDNGYVTYGPNEGVEEELGQ